MFLAVLVGALLFDALSSAYARDSIGRIWDDLVGRTSGAGSFRFYLQPVMGAIMAFRDGLTDARTGRSPYFWTVLHIPEKRAARLLEGLRATSRIIGLGIVMDGLYQFFVLKAFYPVEMIIIVLVLAFLPYVLLRGAFTRIVKWWTGHPDGVPS